MLQPISRWRFKCVTYPRFFFDKKRTSPSFAQTPLAGRVLVCVRGLKVEGVQWCEYSHLHLLNNRRLSAQVARYLPRYSHPLFHFMTLILPGILNRLAKCIFLVSKTRSCLVCCLKREHILQCVCNIDL